MTMTHAHLPDLTPTDLSAYLAAHAPEARLIGDLGETPTVPAAAAALGVEPDQIVKTLLFAVKLPGAPEAALVVVISHGERRVDKRLLAEHFGVGKKHVTLAPAERVQREIGYAVGGVPPVGHRTCFPVLLDASVVEQGARFAGILYAGGGDDRTMLRLTLDDLLRLTAPHILPLST